MQIKYDQWLRLDLSKHNKIFTKWVYLMVSEKGELVDFQNADLGACVHVEGQSFGSPHQSNPAGD